MGGYLDKSSTAGGDNDEYFDRDQTANVNPTNEAGTPGTLGGPPGVSKDDISYDPENPNIARAEVHAIPLDETPATTTTPRIRGSYPGIIEGSDSERTGTSWGLPAVEEDARVEIAGRIAAEGEETGNAHPNRNTGQRLTHDELKDVGSWSTIDKADSAGSPTGNS